MTGMPLSGGLRCPHSHPRTLPPSSSFLSQVMEQKKFQALHGQLSARNMADKEKLALVEVMAPFTYLNCHQIATILQVGVKKGGGDREWGEERVDE